MGDAPNMVAITGSDTYFTNIASATEFTPTQWEACIDQAIDKINGEIGDDLLPNMSGTAGTKTVSVTSAQAGYIRDIAAAIYTSTKTGGSTSKSITAGVISTSESNTSTVGSAQIDMLVKSAALRLKELTADLA